ncbi:glycosyltransferase family 2 protein [Rhodohalobacter sulfatireducens]|nr:glycosyltransferase family 2 protein [Rhodohalobacter sulfatireducens]
MKEAAHISFLIPVFNMAETLPDTLNSLFHVRKFPFEVIVINDGSSDSIEEVIESWADRFSPIPNIEFQALHQENRGRAAALNEGVKVARGEYLSFVDADDVIDGYELLKIWECINSSRSDLIIGQFKIVSDSGREIAKRTLKKETSNETLIQKVAFSPVSPVHLNAILIRREFFLDLDGLDKTNLKSEDKDLLIRLLRSTNSIQFCHSFHYIYRKHALSRGDLIKKRFEWFFYRQKMIRKNFSGMRKYSSMTIQAFFDLAKLFYEGLFKYRI